MPKKNQTITQSVKFTVTQEGEELRVALGFEPEIIGKDNPAFASMTKEQRAMQNYTAHIAALIMGALRNGVERPPMEEKKPANTEKVTHQGDGQKVDRPAPRKGAVKKGQTRKG